jgi:hypothetical protein
MQTRNETRKTFLQLEDCDDGSKRRGIKCEKVERKDMISILRGDGNGYLTIVERNVVISNPVSNNSSMAMLTASQSYLSC